MQFPSLQFHTLAAGCVLACLALATASAQEPPAEVRERETEEATEAGEDQAAPPGVEVIHVRARAGGGLETEVPASMTTFDPATIQALGVEDVSDLSRVTPNVSIVQPGATQATFFVRGIGLSDFSSNAAGAVTIFQDDVAINAPAIQTPQLFDLEGVDIVRGPQGTGHFRNASAGAIRVRSRRPTGNYSGQLRATLGRYQAESGLGARHALIQDYEGALEFPIAENLLASRFAFRLRDADPYKINGCGEKPPIELRTLGDQCGERGSTYVQPGARSRLPAGLPRRVGDAHNWAARGILRLTPPASEWDVQASAHGSRLDQQSTLGQAIGTDRLPPPIGIPGFGGQTLSLGARLYVEPDIVEELFGADGQSGLCQAQGTGLCTNPSVVQQIARNLSRKRPLDIRPYRGDFDTVGNTARDAYGGFVSARGPLGDYELFALASFDAYQRASEEDLDFSADRLIYQLSEDEAWQSYEEITVTGEIDAHLIEWELGGYYLYEDLSAEISNVILDSRFRLFRDFNQQIHSTAVWGDFAWDFLDEFTLEGGVRWNYEQKDLDYLLVNLSNQTLTTEPSESWSEPTGELILTWHIRDRVNLYARYTRGFKAGHYNSIATDRLDNLLALRETNDAWEAGLRGSTGDGRLAATASFFYYLYTDFQVFVFSAPPQQPPTLKIVNAHEAELYGVEIEGQLQPLLGVAPRFLESLLLTWNASWLQGQYIDFSDEQSFREGGGFSTVTFDFSGNDLANAPRYKFSGTVDWTFDLGRLGYLIPRYDVSWTDDQFFDPTSGRGAVTRTGVQAVPKLTVAQKALWLHNVRLAYRTPTGNVEIAGWARNLTDEVYKTFAFDAARFAGVVIHFVGEPRTVGADLTITF